MELENKILREPHLRLNTQKEIDKWKLVKQTLKY